MKRERVSDDIVVFTSTLYAQVNAGAVLTPAGAVLIDTLPFPEETREIADYLESEGAHGGDVAVKGNAGGAGGGGVHGRRRLEDHAPRKGNGAGGRDVLVDNVSPNWRRAAGRQRRSR